jgi:iron complex outermembrane receptor protein
LIYRDSLPLRWLLACAFFATAQFGAANACAQPGAENLLDLSIEELANLKVRSASRIEEGLREAPAAAFIITADEIRRAGVTSIPEALRLAPGLEVAQRGPAEWSISIRGFNSGDLANKLLVLIDGRTVYSPLYAGVFWDVQDTLLEDIERIEVISGPGGTLWGANAVNGVINIITRQASDTQGGYGELLAGDESRLIGGFRFGGRFGASGHARAYVKHVDRDSSIAATGGDAFDGARHSRAGFRVDHDASEADRITLLGEVYAGATDGVFPDTFTIGTLPAGTFRDDIDLAGTSMLGRWERNLGADSDFQLQFYYDRTDRDIPSLYEETRDTIDLDFQHRVPVGGRHDLLWGLAFRQSRDGIANTIAASFDPASRSIDRYGAFVQDRIALRADDLVLTIGSKIAHNDFTGFEAQPSLRLAWHPGRHTLWAAASRAVRIPSRLDDDLVLTIPFATPLFPVPVYVLVNGQDEVESEELLALEAGYRVQAGEDISLDIALFRNDYDRLQTIEREDPIFVLDAPLPHIFVPHHLDNNMRGESVGGTVVANFQPRSRWRIRLQYNYLDLHLDTRAGSRDVGSPSAAGNSPRHQAAAHAFLDLPRDVSLYGGVRYVDELPNQNVDAYVAADVNLAWRLRTNASISLAVRNLTDDTHPEFAGGNGRLVERSAYLKLDWSF